MAMHQEKRAINLSILLASGPAKFSRVGSHEGTGFTSDSAFPSINLRFNLATIPPHNSTLVFRGLSLSHMAHVSKLLVGTVYS